MSKGRFNKRNRGNNGHASVTNGTRPFLVDIDQRSVQAKRYKDLTAEFLHELGTPSPTTWQRLLVCSLSDVTVNIETLRCAMASGQLVNLKAFDRLVSRQRMLMRDLSLSQQVDSDG